MATADSVKSKLQGLIDKSNATTGNSDADLTTAVDALVAGYGKGGGGCSGGGVELNIAYGDTAPEDTSKLWVKTSEPSKLEVKSAAEGEFGNKLEALSGALTDNMCECLSVTYGTDVYVFGGLQLYDNGSAFAYNSIYKINSETEDVRKLSAETQGGVNGGVIGLYNDKIYLVSTSFGKFYCFDTKTNKTSTLGITLTKAWGCAGGYIGNKLYLVGGVEGSNYTNTIRCFNMETEAFNILSATLPCAMHYMSAAVYKSKMYLFGGKALDSEGNRYITDTIICFDTETEMVTQISTKLPVAMQQPIVSSNGEKIYLFGGYSNDGILDTILCFDPITQNIEETSLKLPTPLYRTTAASVGTKIFIPGGLIADTQATNIVHKFERGDILVESGTVSITISTENNFFPLVATEKQLVRIGVGEVYKGNADGIGEPVEAALYKDGAWTTI